MAEDSSNSEVPQIVLEEPAPTDSPGSSLGPIFGEGDAFAGQSQKLAIHEALANLLVKDLTFHEFMRDLLLSVVRIVKCEAGSILELDHAKNHLFFRATSGSASDSVTQFTIPVGQGIVGHVAESRQPVVESKPGENHRHLKVIQDVVGFEARNLIAIPIVIRGKVYGVLELLNRIGEESFSPADLDLLRYICEACAKSIEVRLMLGYAIERSQTQKVA